MPQLAPTNVIIIILYIAFYMVATKPFIQPIITVYLLCILNLFLFIVFFTSFINTKWAHVSFVLNKPWLAIKWGKGSTFSFVPSSSDVNPIVSLKSPQSKAHFNKGHSYHIATPTYIPISLSGWLTMFILSFVTFFSEPISFEFLYYNTSEWPLLYIMLLFLKKGIFLSLIIYSLFFFVNTVYNWTYLLYLDSLSDAVNTSRASKSILFGMSLFIASEIMLFAAFFCALFYFSLSPTMSVGFIWPSKFILVVDPLELPYFNTLLLFTSGVTVNSYYYNLKSLQYFFAFPKNLPLNNLLNSWFLFTLNQDYFILKSKFISSSDSDWLIFLSYLHLLRSLSVYPTDFFKKIYLPRALIFFLHLFNLNDYVLFVLKSISFNSRKILYIALKLKIIISNLFITIYLGTLFLITQFIEYHSIKLGLNFNVNTIYGSLFYSITSLHGLHVFVGLCLLIAVWYLSGFNKNIVNFKFFGESSQPHTFITCAVWYWHFVDIVWLLVFIFLYLNNN